MKFQRIRKGKVNLSTKKRKKKVEIETRSQGRVEREGKVDLKIFKNLFSVFIINHLEISELNNENKILKQNQTTFFSVGFTIFLVKLFNF